MKKLALLMMFFIIGYTGFTQSVSLPEATITPAPLGPVESNGMGIAGFTFAESSGIDVPASAFGMSNVTISVNLQYIELTNGDVNIFYINNDSGVLRAVFVDWSSDGWYVFANSIKRQGGWRAGSRVFSRNS